MCEQIQEENIKDRIKEIREDAGLSQKDFGSKVKLSRSQISCYEKGIRDATDRSIKDICREFDVNEIWLRTGEGGDENIFNKLNDEDRFSINLGKLSITENEFAKSMLNAIAESSPEKLKSIEEFMKSCLGIK